MTINRIGTAAVGLALLTGMVACGDLTSLNQDPNNPLDAPAAAVFTNGTRQAVGRFMGNTYDLRGTEFVAQHLAEAQYPDEDRYYRLQGPQTTTTFDNSYSYDLEDLKKVVDYGLAHDAPSVYGPALVMRTWTYSYITDTWGDVPYSTALKGDSADALLSPTYDKQQDIYNDFFATLSMVDSALQHDSKPDTTVASGDPIYGGDMTQWRKFANSLHARLALRVINVNPGLAAAELAKAIPSPGAIITDNADNAKLTWPGDGKFDNPWADNFDTRDDHRMSKTLMDILKASNDPRMPIYAQPADTDLVYSDRWGGMPNGLKNSTAATWIKTASKPGEIFYADHGGYSLPSFLFTAAEGNFILAEVAERGLAGLSAGQAAGYYNAGIRASMEQWGVASSDIDDYLAQPGVAYQGGSAGLKQIAVQKWLALFTDGGQAWFEWRRTCQPSTIVAGPDAMVNFVPRRFEYSLTEYTVNSENLDAAITDMGGTDDFAATMWWDKNQAAAPTYENSTVCAGTPSAP